MKKFSPQEIEKVKQAMKEFIDNRPDIGEELDIDAINLSNNFVEFLGFLGTQVMLVV